MIPCVLWILRTYSYHWKSVPFGLHFLISPSQQPLANTILFSVLQNWSFTLYVNTLVDSSILEHSIALDLTIRPVLGNLCLEALHTLEYLSRNAINPLQCLRATRLAVPHGWGCLESGPEPTLSPVLRGTSKMALTECITKLNIGFFHQVFVPTSPVTPRWGCGWQIMPRKAKYWQTLLTDWHNYQHY